MKCPKCHHENPEDAKFCQECGNRLFAASETVKTSSIPEAERKRVTALFSDLTGYTAMTERLDPEEVKEITGRIFNGVKAVVSKYEGFIEKFAGDGVLALFGVPRAHEDDPVRAIQAAREIHGLVETLSPRYETKIGRPLSMHSGINTGLVVTADVDEEKGTHGVTGKAINVAARLSNLAEAREILVGPNTYRASQTHFAFQPLKPAKVKGKSERIPVYKVLSEKAATACGHEMQVSSEMVGRDQELAKLELHILKAVNGQGSVVNIFGEPGIGKSRLLAELRQREVISRVSFLEGRSISIGKNLSFHPIIDLYKQWAKIKENDTQTEASNKLETAINHVCEDEVDEVFPFVATMMGMKLSDKHSQRVEGIEGEALEKLILKNVRELLIRSTELIPIVIVMEDLHWADTTSLELLESVFRLARTYRVVFINVFRSGYWQGDDRKIETLPEWLPEVDFAEIAIKPLDRQTGEALVNNMLQVKGLRYAVKQKIVVRSGGNPFFIEEIVRSLIDEGAIVRTNGAFEVTEKIDHVVIPSTINDVLMARIDRLEEQTRDLIKVASVIGRSFFDRILKEVAASIEGVDESLGHLKETQFIRDRMRMEELEHLFKHALAQEVVYESILHKKRIYMHLQVAASIEHLFNDKLYEFYGLLAYHYGKGKDVEKTEEYLIKAGEESLKSSASNEALNCFKEALNLYLTNYGDNADPEKIAMFEKNIGLAYYNKGSFFNALEHFDIVLERSGQGLPKSKFHKIFRLVCDMSILILKLYFPLKQSKLKPTEKDNLIFDVFQKRGIALIYLDTERFFFENISFIRKMTRFDIKQINTGVYSFCSSSGIFSLTGLSFNISNRILKSSKKLIDKNDIKELLCYNFYKFFLNEMSGSWFECSEYDEELVNLNLKKGRTWLIANYFLLQGLLKIERGFFAQAELLSEKLNEIWEVYEYQNARGLRYFLMTILLFKQRKFNDAKIMLGKGISYQKEMGEELTFFYYLALKAVIQILQKDQNAAIISLNHAKEIVTRKGRVIPFYLSRYLIGCFLFDLNMLEKTILSKDHSNISKYKKRTFVSAKKALNTAKKYAPDKVEALKLMGTFSWLINRKKKALKYWKESINVGKKMGSFVELSRTYFEVGKRLLEDGSEQKELKGIGAEEYLNKARNIFEDLDLQWDLEQLERFSSNI